MDFSQSSFSAGMNLLVDDTRLPIVVGYKLGDNPYKIGYNQYRLGINVRNRFDVLQPILQSKIDTAAPTGIKQELVTFGNFVILFVAGLAYYRLYTDTGWKLIEGFQMSTTAPRFWTCFVPVAITNYVRIANVGITNAATSDAKAGIQLSAVAGASAGNISGLLVQDNINQPQFIFLDDDGNIDVRITQSFTEWSIQFTDPSNTVVATAEDGTPLDFREYVPIGNVMTWENGVLYVASQDSNYIYRSVSGRPLDFVINVTNILAANTTEQSWEYTDPITGNQIIVDVEPYSQSGGGAFDASNVFHQGGDATTTSYSVGVGGITTLRPIASGGIFVAASNANFAVTQNMTQNAPTEFGEYTFIRTFLFNATCLSDRTIIDSLGDTKFIDLTGIRSFNAVEQEQNEGRNSQFSATIQGAFGDEANPLIQNSSQAAAILYNNYELYGVNTIYGPALAVYDTILSCWTSLDLLQIPTQIKILAKIELTIQRLYAIGIDDNLYELYGGTEFATSYVRLGAAANEPKFAHKLTDVRLVLNNVTKDCEVSATVFTDNRVSDQPTITKKITYSQPTPVYTGPINMPDVNTMCQPVSFMFPNTQQGWKTFALLSWNNGNLTTVSMTLTEAQPMNQLTSQANVK